MRKIVFILICFIAISCGNDEESKKRFELEGRWTLEEAQRNGKETQTLKGAFFRFNQDQGMTTNIMGTEVNSDYEQRDRDIVQKKPQEIVYTIEQYSDSLMTLSTELRGTAFKFILKRSSSNQ